MEDHQRTSGPGGCWTARKHGPGGEYMSKEDYEIGFNKGQAYLFDNDDRFFDGWQLDYSWILCTVSWTVLALSGAGLVSAAVFLPEEGNYELIPN